MRLGACVAVAGHRPTATAPIGPVAWEPPYAADSALEKSKRQKNENKNPPKHNTLSFIAIKIINIKVNELRHSVSIVTISSLQSLLLIQIYDKLGEIDGYFGFTSFKNREWTLILNDLIQIYPKIDFI